MFKDLPRCQYVSDYEHPLVGGVETFTCHNTALESGLCKFHDENYWEEHEMEMSESILKHITQGLQSHLVLCVGFHFPTIQIKLDFHVPVIFERCIFEGYADFAHSNFYSSVNFSNSIFKNVAGFRGAIQFQQDTIFQNVRFDDDAEFRQATFSRDVDFRGSVFSGEVDFIDCIFGTAHFGGESRIDDENYHVTFLDNVYFRNAQFSSTVDFQASEFKKLADFYETKFLRPVDFQEASFNNSSFIKTTFSDEVNFLRADFQEAIFHACTFQQVIFDNTTFSKFDCDRTEFNKFTLFSDSKFSETRFLSCVFRANAFFVDAIFSQKTSFLGVEFNDTVLFNKSKFDNDVEFIGAHFLHDAMFSDVKFNGKTVFTGATRFEKIAYFVGSSFSEVSFLGIPFRAKADFSEVNFHNVSYYKVIFNEADFSNSKFIINSEFRLVRFENAENTLFDIDDLTNTSFVNTDISRVNFGERVRWGSENTFQIYDERLLIKHPESVSLGAVLSTYRNLRENYEFRLKYDEAGAFFIREMELKRNYKNTKSMTGSKQKSRIQRYFSLLSFYFYLAKYGEDVKRPIIWSFVVLVSAGLYYWFIPNHLITETHKIAKSAQILENVLGSFFQIESSDLSHYLIRILSIPIFGTLFISLRRKFERRFRH